MVERITLVNNYGIFGYDAQTGEIRVDNAAGLKKGKNYTLKFNVHYEGQAVNAKDKIVSVKISIK